MYLTFESVRFFALCLHSSIWAMINRQRGKICFSTFRPPYVEELPYCLLTPPPTKFSSPFFLVIWFSSVVLVCFLCLCRYIFFFISTVTQKTFHATSYEAEKTCFCGWVGVRSHMSYHRHQETLVTFTALHVGGVSCVSKRSVVCKGDPSLMSQCEDNTVVSFQRHEDKTESPHFLMLS